MRYIMPLGIQYDPYTRKFLMSKWAYKKYCANCRYNVKSQDEGRRFMSVWCCGLVAKIFTKCLSICLHCGRDIKKWNPEVGQFCGWGCKNVYRPNSLLPCKAEDIHSKMTSNLRAIKEAGRRLSKPKGYVWKTCPECGFSVKTYQPEEEHLCPRCFDNDKEIPLEVEW